VPGSVLRDNFKKTQQRDKGTKKPQVPEGMFIKCESCKNTIYYEDSKEQFHCCPRCGRHFRIDPWRRLEMVVDVGTFTEWDEELSAQDPLGFAGYPDKLKAAEDATGLTEAVITGKARIKGIPTAIGIMSADFLMGSLGSATGEKITRMVERATKERLPVVLFCASGGARMQEGTFALMQMAKTAQALKKHDEAGLFYVSVLTDPTMGGVTASFAMLGDVILAEPGARIGFAGARVIAQTIGGKLPEGFQSAEFLVKHGFIDRIVQRKEMRKVLAVLLGSSRGISL
jgi:acetyl-CoA carboxylase carboxyl transferase subunit beta